VLSLYAIQGLNTLLPLVTLPFLLRALHPAGYGAIMFAQSLMGYALLVVEFGFNFTAAREISVARDQPQAVARIYWTTLAAKTLLLAVSGLAVALVVVATPAFRQDWPVFAASGLLLAGNVAFPQWYFQGLERLREVAAIQAVAKLIAAGCVIALVRAPDDRVIAAAILSAPQLLAVGAALVLRKPLAPERFHLPSLRDIRQALGQSWHLFAASLSTTLYLHTNTFVLGLMRGPEAVALYSLANRLIGAMQSLVTPVAQALFPRASRLFVENRAQAWHLLKRVAWVLLPAIVLGSLLLAIFAPTAVRLLGGSAFSGVVPVLRTMAIVPVLVTVATLLAQTVMVNIGLNQQLFRIYLTVGLLNLALLPMLIHAYDAQGAALALVVAETLGPLLMGWVVWRRARAQTLR
jgi:PST family polysaccharide transporter